MVCALIQTLNGAPVFGQTEQRDQSIADLPRPGYEPRTVRIGGTVIEPSVTTSVQFDDNIFATPDSRQSDFVFDLRPSATLRNESARLDLQAEAYGDLRRYARFARENVTTFGVNTTAAMRVNNLQTLTSKVSFDRLFERRGDPEASVDRSRPPALINNLQASLDYRLRSSRVELAANVAISTLDYLPEIDSDRDLLTYNASLRGALKLKSGISVFVQPYATRRDARLAIDRSGVDRDTTTLGIQGGVSFDLAERLQGDMGIGGFRASPDDPSLKSFTGLAFNGRLSWRPRVRTAVTFGAFRGDVATIRAGAQGRIDTRFSLSVDQEVRHNLLLHSIVGYRGVHYRGTLNRDQHYISGEAGVRYLINRHLAFTLDGGYTRRGASVPTERFRRWSLMTALVFKY